MKTVFYSCSAAFCLLGLFVALVESSSKVNKVKTLRELDQISAYLAVKGPSEGQPDKDLELVIEDSQLLRGSVVQSLQQMATGAGCDERKAIDELGAVYDKLQDQRVGKLMRHTARLYFDRCMSSFEQELGEKFAQIGDKQKEKLQELLSRSFIEKYFSQNPEMVDRVDVVGEIGLLFNKSARLLVEFIQSKFKDVRFNPKKRKHLIKGAKIVAERLGNSCPDYYKRSRQSVGTLRRLVSMVGDDEKTKLTRFSKDFQDNMFRFRYCEEIMKSKNSKIMMRNIKMGALANKGTNLLVRRKRSLVVALFIVFVIAGALIVAFTSGKS